MIEKLKADWERARGEEEAALDTLKDAGNALQAAKAHGRDDILGQLTTNFARAKKAWLIRAQISDAVYRQYEATMKAGGAL